MKKIDARKLKQEVQQAIRDQVIRLRKEGKMNRDIVHFLGISEQHTSTHLAEVSERRKEGCFARDQRTAPGREENAHG